MALLREFWAYVVLPQVLDHLESTGFEMNKCTEIKNLVDGQPWRRLGISVIMPGEEETRAFKRAVIKVIDPVEEEDTTDEMHPLVGYGRHRWRKVNGQTLEGKPLSSPKGQPISHCILRRPKGSS